MKKVLLSLIILISFLQLQAQTVIPLADELVLPKYLGRGNTTGLRTQYACRLKLTGLTANATYRYIVGASNNAALATTATSPGNMFAISNVSQPVGGYIVGYTTSKGLAGTILDSNELNTATARYMEFTTDASGNYTGWFAMVATGNSAFNAGNDVYFYVQVNNGTGGTSIAQNFRTTSTIRMIDYGTTAGTTNQSSAIRGNSYSQPENFVIGYDTIGARPAFATWIENDGILTAHTTWYNIAGPNGVDSINGAWGTVYSNNTPTGIIRIELQDINGTSLFTNNSPTGIWGSTNTVNPTAGAIPMAIAIADAPLPVKYKSITLKNNQLLWSTASEVNNRGFEVWRSNNSGAYQKIAFVAGKGNSNQVSQYQFTDEGAPAGSNCYKLKQVDFNGKYAYSKVVCQSSQMPVTYGMQVTPNPFNNELLVTLNTQASTTAKVVLMDMLGNIQYQSTAWVEQGKCKLSINTEALLSGIYFIRATANAQTYTQKIVKY